MENVRDSFLLNHLCCVQCGNKLRKGNNQLICDGCSQVYPIDGGIPDLLIKETPYQSVNPQLIEQYENFGKKTTRKKNFSNTWRKKKTMELVEGKTVLEIGTAEGWLTKDLVQKSETVVSCDISMSYLKRAQDAGIQAEFIRIDAHMLPFENGTFDCVVLTEVLEHVFSPCRVLEEISRVMKKNGLLILSMPNNLSISSELNLFPSINLSGHFLHKSTIVEMCNYTNAHLHKIFKPGASYIN